MMQQKWKESDITFFFQMNQLSHQVSRCCPDGWRPKAGQPPSLSAPPSAAQRLEIPGDYGELGVC